MNGFIRNPLTGKTKIVKLVEHDGVLVRKNFTQDIQVLLEWKATYRHSFSSLLPNDVVLDIGANIGMFTRRASGVVKKVIAVEPEPGAFSVLTANAAKNCLCIAGAVTKVKGTAVLSIPRTGGSTSASTAFNKRGRGTLEVKAFSLSDLVKKHKVTVIKTDCEGAEVEWLNGRTLPKSVRMVVGELHREGDGSEETADKIIKSFSGWRNIHAPKSYSFNRCWTVAWERK